MVPWLASRLATTRAFRIQRSDGEFIPRSYRERRISGGQPTGNYQSHHDAGKHRAYRLRPKILKRRGARLMRWEAHTPHRRGQILPLFRFMPSLKSVITAVEICKPATSTCRGCASHLIGALRAFSVSLGRKTICTMFTCIVVGLIVTCG